MPEETKKRRSETLLALAKKQSGQFRESYIGESVEVLFEESKKIGKTFCQVGYTGEYIRAAKRTGENLSGKICVGKLAGYVRDSVQRISDVSKTATGNSEFLQERARRFSGE